MKVLLTGAGGQLGESIVASAPDDWQLIALPSAEYDITNSNRTEEIFKEHAPEIVINAAAYTSVDKAEEEEQLARAINAAAVKNLAVKCKETNAFLVHISTDYVFDGTSNRPYKEDDTINPMNIYGKTKAEGEKNILRSGADFVIIRTSWVFSEYGSNFLKSMLKLGKNKLNLKIVSDQMGAPTYAGDIAKVIKLLIENKDKSNKEIYHFTGDQITSWADFANIIFEIALSEGKLIRPVAIEGITTEQYGAPAPRPKNSVLDCRKIKKLSDIKLSDWRGATKKIISEYNE